MLSVPEFVRGFCPQLTVVEAVKKLQEHQVAVYGSNK
jgi:hypothetical protein